MSDETTILHGTFMNLYGVGTHIMGAPGIGKSELALALISRAHQLVADDVPFFTVKNGRIIGKNLLEKHFLSVRGIGLIDVETLFGSTSINENQELHLIIQLQIGETDHALSHLMGHQTVKEILGCLIPCVTIPIIKPRNLEILVETIVKNYLVHKNNKGVFPLTHLESLLRKKMEPTHT